jgi:GTP cyclohydrolase I
MERLVFAAAPRNTRDVKKPDYEAMKGALTQFLDACGLDLTEPDLASTAERVSRTWIAEFLDGYARTPAEILGAPVVGEADPDVVIVGGLRFHAMCPHHLLPYRGLAHVAYIPNGKLVGFGRLGELVECFAHRLTLQERITHQIAQALVDHLHAAGAGCVMEAEQMCLAIPGEKHDQSGIVTSAFVGAMRERPDLKARLLEAARIAGK